MDGCVGREKELEFLNDLWEKVPVSCAVCGRRHLGKTALVKEFTRDKRHIYITGTPGLASDNLSEISGSLSKLSGKKENISDISDLFPRIREICAKEKTVVVIDRLSELSENFDEINAYIRAFMNRDLSRTRIMLVVCDKDNSVFGRFYYTLELKPMNYMECKGFHPDYTSIQHLKAYALVGGTPAYQKLIGERTPEEVMRTRMFDHMSVFSLEAEGIVASDTHDMGGSAKILSAIAGGAESIKDISAKTGLASAYVVRVLEDMEHKGILMKEVSSGLSRRSVYSINSNILRFYFQIVYRHMHAAEFGSVSEAYDEAEKDIAAYMEREFKNVCMEYVSRNYEYKFIGKLRRKDDSVDKIIDFLASVSQKSSDRVLIAKCRLYGNPFGKHDFDELVERAKKVDGSNKLYMMFSGVGFTRELEEAAKTGYSLKLLTLDTVYGCRRRSETEPYSELFRTGVSVPRGNPESCRRVISSKTATTSFDRNPIPQKRTLPSSNLY